MNPYEEINELIKIMKKAKETLEDTDAEYFDESQIDSLIELSQDIISLSLGVKVWYAEE